MTVAGRAHGLDRSTILPAVALAIASAVAWVIVVRSDAAMEMRASWAEGARFTVMWGAMMAAMMLPSAAPMILLFGTVSRSLRGRGERAIPTWAFAAIYLLAWTLLGVPVYAGYLLVARLAANAPAFASVEPYLVAAVVAIAGVYQWTAAKRACLQFCESPLDVLMRRWRSGYGATARIALAHAGYCIGCCWGLMAILVVAGAMSLPWVIGIAVLVFLEKLIGRGERAARAIGVVLVVLSAAIMLRPELAVTLRGEPMQMSER